MTRFDGTDGRGSPRGATGEHRRAHLTLVRPAAEAAPDAARGHREPRADHDPTHVTSATALVDPAVGPAHMLATVAGTTVAAPPNARSMVTR